MPADNPTPLQLQWIQSKGIIPIILDGTMWFKGNQCASMLKYADCNQAIRKSVGKKNKSTLANLCDNGLAKQLAWGQNDYKTVYVTWEGFCILICKKRSPFSTRIAKTLGIDVVRKHLSHEGETLDSILKSFPGEIARLQHPVAGYRLDLYFPEHNIVVECDEGAHASYDRAKEAERNQTIMHQLGHPTIIRYNPDAVDFDTHRIVGRVFQEIRASLVKK